jgi:hypothetical protein
MCALSDPSHDPAGSVCVDDAKLLPPRSVNLRQPVAPELRQLLTLRLDFERGDPLAMLIVNVRAFVQEPD